MPKLIGYPPPSFAAWASHKLPERNQEMSCYIEKLKEEDAAMCEGLLKHSHTLIMCANVDFLVSKGEGTIRKHLSLDSPISVKDQIRNFISRAEEGNDYRACSIRLFVYPASERGLIESEV